MFGRLESVLNSEITTLGHPRAALLGFAVAVLAYNLLALLKRCVEHAHRQEAPQIDCCHLPPGPARQGRLRGLAHRRAARVLAELSATGQRSGGAAPAGFGPAHHPPASGHQQARPQDRKPQGLGCPSQGSGACFHGTGAQGSEGTKTLKGMHLRRGKNQQRQGAAALAAPAACRGFLPDPKLISLRAVGHFGRHGPTSQPRCAARHSNRRPWNQPLLSDLTN